MGQKGGGWGHIRTMSPPSAYLEPRRSQRDRNNQPFFENEGQRLHESSFVELGAAHGIAERGAAAEAGDEREEPRLELAYLHRLFARARHTGLGAQRLIHGRRVVHLIHLPHGVDRIGRSQQSKRRLEPEDDLLELVSRKTRERLRPERRQLRGYR